MPPPPPARPHHLTEVPPPPPPPARHLTEVPAPTVAPPEVVMCPVIVPPEKVWVVAGGKKGSYHLRRSCYHIRDLKVESFSLCRDCAKGKGHED